MQYCMRLKDMSLLVLVICAVCSACATSSRATVRTMITHSWEVLPIPRYVDYGSPKHFVMVKSAAIVRRSGGPYQTVRDKAGELVGSSTVTEEELTGILRENGIAGIDSVSDDLVSYDGYDTLILLGSPEHNTLTERMFSKMKLSFSKWDDPNTPEDDFADWKGFGREGYVLKVGKADGKNIVILAGYDHDDARGTFYGAGTFYAMQSLRQMIVKDARGVRIKTAEIADKPLVGYRGHTTGWDGNVDKQFRDIAQLAVMKANNNI